MSASRVHYGTTNDTVTPANSSGFCGFTSPVQAWPGSDPDGNHPVGIPTQKAIGWYWRVKRWHIATDITTTNSIVGSTFSLDNCGQPSRTTSITSEIELAVPGVAANYAAEGGETGDFGLGPANITDRFQFGIFPGFRDFSVPTDYPKIDLVGNIIGIDPAFPTIEYPLLTLNANGSLLVPDGSFTAFLDSEAITVYYQNYTSMGPVGDWSFGGSQLVLTPVEYWPYAAEDGSPIYDTMTGVQLQSPTN